MTVDPTKLTATNAASGTYVPLNVDGNSGTLNSTLTYPWTPSGTTYYTWPYDNGHDARIATLEGEVKVLREMLAAMLSGRTPRTRKAK